MTITLGGQTATAGSQYNYDSSSTPTITALSTATASPAGGAELVITGTTFGYESPFNQVSFTLVTSHLLCCS